MINLRSALALILALGLGGLTVYLAWQWMRPVAQAPAPRRVVLAAQPLPPGTLLKKELMKIADWPASAGALPPDIFERPGELEGRMLKEAVGVNAPLKASALAPGGSGILPGLMAPGMRAITLPVDPVASVAGFALPGSRVDVLLSGQTDAFKLYGKASPGKESSSLNQRLTFSKVVLENLRVLAMSQQTASVDGKPQLADSATLEVTPEQAVTLNLARQLGSLALVLRRPEDLAGTVPAGQIELALLQTASAPKAHAAPRGPCTQVYEGGQAVSAC